MLRWQLIKCYFNDNDDDDLTRDFKKLVSALSLNTDTHAAIHPQALAHWRACFRSSFHYYLCTQFIRNEHDRSVAHFVCSFKYIQVLFNAVLLSIWKLCYCCCCCYIFTMHSNTIKKKKKRKKNVSVCHKTVWEKESSGNVGRQMSKGTCSTSLLFY